MGMNGRQLYGLSRLRTALRMARHPALKGLSWKQKLALNYVAKESKLTEVDGKIFSNTFTPYYPSLAYDRFLDGVIKVGSGTPVPVVTNFAVTAKCPCRCWHCSFAGRSKLNDLTLEEMQESIKAVQDLGAGVIGLTGGEPLLRKDLEDIIACIGEKSMPLLFTTGFELSPERVRRLKEAGLGIPVISLDHYTAEVHDQGRNRPGMFDTALAAIQMFQDEGFYVAVSFVPSRKLVDDKADFFKTIEFFQELGVNDMRLTSPILAGHLTDHPEEKLSRENVVTVWEAQQKCTKTEGYPGVFAYDYFESDKFYGCGAGYNYLFIDAEGNLCPCDFTMLTFGNLREKPIPEIWDEMSRRFPAPGFGCYANRAAGLMAQKASGQWPLGPEASREVTDQVRPDRPGEVPEFYRRIGLKPPVQ
jgi:MoaA/NifB/PqqE/SkfB family radical SAM enzyme